ncbi:MAG: hypothetical protein ABEJ57_01370 [Halobacteriaceae archaeon]
MDSKRAARWAGVYFLLTVVATVVGVAVIAGGTALGVQELYETYDRTGDLSRSALMDAIPGLLVAAIGIAIWRFGKAIAFYKTLTGAVAEELADTYDNQQVKSEILAVLDDRLADMQQDIQSINRELRDVKNVDDGFDD